MNSPSKPTEIAIELGLSGLCICPDFLKPQLLNTVRGDLERVQREGGFHRAGIGHGATRGVHENIRRDHVHWLDRETINPIQTSLWEQFDSLKQAFNRTLFLGLGDLEAHYAAYPSGGFYQRHLDSFAHDNLRVVSLVLYLNENWKSSDGGQLRVYNAGATHTDIDPVGGTLVCFMSKESEHEVLPSFSPRLSIAGWFTRPPQR